MKKLIMVIGLPASGKSTYAKYYKEKGYFVHSSDDLREELLGDRKCQTRNDIIFQALHDRVRTSMELGQNIILDATNINMKKRRAFLNTLSKYKDYNKKAVVMATPFNICIQRDKDREYSVGHSVIERMYKSFQFPLEQEGFDEITICHDYVSVKDTYLDVVKDSFDYEKQLRFLDTVPQYNKNHTLTIGKHCRKVYQNLSKESWELQMAGLLHDIGKLKTMSFRNTKGEYHNQAHFYNHENVSAYDAMAYLFARDADVVRTCQIIAYHMRPHLLKTEKSINKFKKFVEEEFWNELLIFNKADKEGR